MRWIARTFIIAVVASGYISTISAQFEGEPCVLTNSGIEGKCTLIDECPFARKLLKSKKRPQMCGFVGKIPVVCCPPGNTTLGKTRWERCLEYITPTKYGGNDFVFGGNKSLAMEFPHMALLGYGNRSNIQWLCGGSLISERFVLTAAHCQHSSEYGNVQIVRLGELDISSTTDLASPEDFDISEVIVHPSYSSAAHYHDIALIRLQRDVRFDPFKKPACLYGTKSIPEDIQFIATGWGKVGYVGDTSSHLMKVYLQYIDDAKCAQRYTRSPSIKLPEGVKSNLQICAGDPLEGKDTCPGDSGGPLQVARKGPYFHYQIVGITSFGRACGVEDSAGVYTKISYYMSWIENIVWKGDIRMD